ncbi:MAG: PQQ-binding-like beta-propeller repeat protein [Bacteroidales bacterium]|nr:PQQ-binding-like beta-propeller repeat protein [Bacteroidales bacterium]
MKKMNFLALMLTTCSLLAQNTTIQWRNDRTGIYNETGLLQSWPASGPQLLWYYDKLGDGHASVAISDEKIYVTGMTNGKGYLYVFDTNGQLTNRKEYGPEWTASYVGSRGAVTINDGKLYIHTAKGFIYCLDEQTLDMVWQKDFLKEFNGNNIRWGLNESFLIVEDKLIVTPGGKTHNIVALNKKDGSLIWSSKGVGSLSSYCSPLYISDQQVPQIVTMTSSHIVGVDIANGNTLWSHPHQNMRQIHPNTPVYHDNMVLCTSGYGKGSVMLRLTNGGTSVEKVWESDHLETKTGGVVKIGNYAYGSGDNHKYWYCVDWNTGKTMFKSNLLGGTGVTIAADGMLYCYSERGLMALVRPTPEKFDVVSQFPITKGTDQHWAHPVIYDGVLYVRHGNTLMAYKIK